jgi:hypothetical protein
MSDKLTGIYLPSLGFGSGWSEWGDHAPAEMIHKIRRNAEIAKEEADRILAAADEDFVVETYYGPFAQKNRKRIWPAEAGA